MESNNSLQLPTHKKPRRLSDVSNTSSVSHSSSGTKRKLEPSTEPSSSGGLLELSSANLDQMNQDRLLEEGISKHKTLQMSYEFGLRRGKEIALDERLTSLTSTIESLVSEVKSMRGEVESLEGSTDTQLKAIHAAMESKASAATTEPLSTESQEKQDIDSLFGDTA